MRQQSGPVRYLYIGLVINSLPEPILTCGLTPTFQAYHFTNPRYGDAAVHAAAWYGHLDTVCMLATLGADLQARNSGGGVPLYLAASGGHGRCVEFLLDAGTDVNVSDEDGDTCLHDAACYNHVEVATVLLARGANVEAENTYRFTPLMLAAQHGARNVVGLLLRHGANPNAKNYRSGRTALHDATEMRRHKVVALLLAAGSSWESRDENGVSPHRLAMRGGAPEVIAAFDKCFELHYAAERGDVASISAAVLDGDVASPPCQWIAKLPPSDRVTLTQWARGIVNDMGSCYIALFVGDQCSHRSNIGENTETLLGAAASDTALPSISLRDVVHDGNPHLQRLIVAFLVARCKTTRRALHFLALEA